MVMYLILDEQINSSESTQLSTNLLAHLANLPVLP